MRSAAEAAPSFLYLPEVARAPERFALPPEEGHYVSRVVRARAGEALRASDGAGTLAELVLEEIRTEPRVRLVRRSRAPERAPRVLLCGPPEDERGDWMVEKLAELGVSRLVPVQCEQGSWAGRDRAERWHRLAVAALRQSRSPWLMEVAPPKGLREASEGIPGLGAAERWLADPGGGVPGLPVGRAGETLVGAVGGAAGFTEAERGLLRDLGFVTVALAPARLRTETAALALAALWAARDVVTGNEA